MDSDKEKIFSGSSSSKTQITIVVRLFGINYWCNFGTKSSRCPYFLLLSPLYCVLYEVFVKIGRFCKSKILNETGLVTNNTSLIVGSNLHID